MKQDFWDILFDEGDYIFTARNVYGRETSADLTQQFFSINSIKGLRKDENVTTFRNILLEFDQGSPADQLNALTDVPHSTLVWSGGKSHHAIISLAEPCKNCAEYDALVRRIYVQMPMVDRAVKNPSRLSRTPNAIRDNGNVQHLVHIKNRISRAELDAWLGPEPEKLKTEQPKLRSLALSPWTRYFFLFGSVPGQRNADLFKAACDMFRHGYDLTTIVDRAEEVLDLPRTEIVNTVRSAQAAVRRG